MEKIKDDTVVSEILNNYPRMTDYLMDLGLCGCGHDSSLKWTVAQVAQERGFDLNELLDELNSRRG